VAARSLIRKPLSSVPGVLPQLDFNSRGDVLQRGYGAFGRCHTNRLLARICCQANPS